MLASTFLALAGLALVNAQESSPDYVNPLQAKVLIYTYCDGFRHDSIPTAIESLKEWGPYYNVSFDATEDQSKITTANLAQYDALIFVHSTGNVFSSDGQTAFVDYMSKGGNFAAIHAAAAGYLTKTGWGPYTNSLGATFDHHPKFQPATFVKEMSNHPATNSQPDRWSFGEEVYSFTSDPRKLGVKLLWSVDPTSYDETGDVGQEGKPHPISWYQDYAAGATVGKTGPGVAGRSFYSSLGHANSTWKDATFMKHVMGGLTWTFGSNTTRVAKGLYNGAEPTVHTGSSNNSTSSATNAWNPVLGSDAVAPPPPTPKTPSSSSSASTPASTGGATSGNTSGAVLVAPAGALALGLAALGAILASF